MGQATALADAGFIENATDRVRKCSAAAAAIKALASVSENEINRLRDYMRDLPGCRSTAELEDWMEMIELFSLIAEKAELIADEAQAVERASYTADKGDGHGERR